MPRQENATIRIWDPFVRLSHWILVAAFFIAYFSEDDLLSLHVWAGYVLGVIVLLRIVWGVVGPRHARFSDFLYRPTEVMTYMRELLSFRGKRYLGHSPVGGAMVVTLLPAGHGRQWSCALCDRGGRRPARRLGRAPQRAWNRPTARPQ